MERQAATKAQKTPGRVNRQQTQSARSSSTAHPLLQLQSSIGNQAVQRVINSSYIQTKLQVSTPGDPYEQEADRVADTVMRQAEPPTASSPSQHVVVQNTRPLIGRSIEHNQSKAAGSDQPAIVQRKVPPLAVREDDDEERLAPLPDPNTAAKEDRKKLEDKKPLQRQTREDDESPEEKVETSLPIQRQLEDEEEELLTPKVDPGSLIQRLCTECELEHQKQQEEPAAIAQRTAAHEQLQASSDLQQRLDKSKGGGRQLPAETRSFFQSSLGADFSSVQVHTGADAVAMNKELGAHAFTHGSDIYFNAGKY